MIKTSVLINKTFREFVDVSKLIKVSKCIFEHFNIFDAELSVSLVGDDEIKILNNKYRSIDTPTDVLSFPSKDINPETGIRYYGDIVISYQAAERQFADYHDSVKEEVISLVIHGILHLLDFDHKNHRERSIMLDLQNHLFNKIKTIINA